MAQVSNINIRPAGGGMSAVTTSYLDGSSVQFVCPEAAALVITELATQLRETNAQQVATADSLRRYIRGGKSRTRDSDIDERVMGNKVTPELMAIMRRVAPKYNEWMLGDDSRMAALDVLKLAPYEAISAVNQQPLSEMTLNDAVGTLIAVADYMQANKIDPLPLTDSERIQRTADAARKMWNK